MSKSRKTEFELYVIRKIMEKRLELDLTQDDIAIFLDVSRGFIGQVESPNHPAKYNLNHINLLARELGCSPKDFLPEMPMPNTFAKKR